VQTARPKLTDEQKSQLKTCFELMDADGSGAIDADELSDAFELLGLKYTRAEIQERFSIAGLLRS
jgi:centrin-1